MFPELSRTALFSENQLLCYTAGGEPERACKKKERLDLPLQGWICRSTARIHRTWANTKKTQGGSDLPAVGTFTLQGAFCQGPCYVHASGAGLEKVVSFLEVIRNRIVGAISTEDSLRLITECCCCRFQ
ncbi:hypothetical protein AOLI_G00302850 [Acnodon oligacanthus]